MPMRILDARIHFILDVAFALAFALGPLVFGLGGSPAAVSFVIALVFVVLAATVWWSRTRKTGTVSILHGLTELAVAVLLAVLPRIDGYSPGSPARTFVWTMAIAVGLGWLLTAYGDTRATLPTAAEEPAPPRS
jgi:hypothetical protein